MKKFLNKIIFTIFASLLFNNIVFAENIHFNDDIFKLQHITNIEKSDVIINEYYLDGENKKLWSKMIEITYFPDVNNPLKYAQETDKKIEADEKYLLLKFIQNKKQDIALISYLENGINNNNIAFFNYIVCKYEKHPKKGMMVLKYVRNYDFKTQNEIFKIAKEVKENNNDYMEKLIISSIPPIVAEQ